MGSSQKDHYTRSKKAPDYGLWIAETLHVQITIASEWHLKSWPDRTRAIITPPPVFYKSLSYRALERALKSWTLALLQIYRSKEERQVCMSYTVLQ